MDTLENATYEQQYAAALSTVCRRLRERGVGLSQLKFATKSGLDCRVVERFEDASHGKNLQRIILISEAFGLHPSVLMAEAEKLLNLPSHQNSGVDTDCAQTSHGITFSSAFDVDDFIDNERAQLVRLLKLSEEPKVDPSSDIVDAKFAKNFQMSLVLHHAHSAQPLIKQLFEHKFLEACIARGWSGFIESSPVNPGRDVHANNTDWSLKTEAAKSSSRHKIKISKFCEARWIRECRGPADYFAGIAAHIIPHLNRYERIILLKVTEPSAGMISYALYELDTDLLRLMGNVGVGDFAPRSVNGSSSVPVMYKGERAFTLRFDGSVEKITIEQISTKLCRFHGEWIIPKSQH
ncbi:MAG: hypothetical protein V7707_20170 [Motiliproteus sp.]